MLLVDGAMMLGPWPPQAVGCNAVIMIRAIVDQPLTPSTHVTEVRAALTDILPEKIKGYEATPTLLMFH